MKKNVLWAFAACSAMLLPGINANAQDEVVVTEEVVTVTEVPCKTHYYSSNRDNWFIQFGAGINGTFAENYSSTVKDPHHQMSVAYNFGFGKWISPYLGWRVSFLGGPIHWNQCNFRKAKYVNANVDFMWDMLNSFHGVNTRRVFSMVPFVGLGGTFMWDFNHTTDIIGQDGKPKSNSWTLPVSAGIQFRFRLSRHVDFFAEGRAQFYGDNWNNTAEGYPVDINLTAIGGFSINIGGCDFKSYNPCDYVGYINNLNGQVNDLRAALATSAAALAAAEAQLPCPEVTEPVTVTEVGPLMATVRFSLNSARIRDDEMVNIYNVARYLKQNPDQSIVIAGYADKDTGTSEYNMGLSKRRAEAVKKALVDKYGISPDRLTIRAEGSSVQPYDVNNWNRIVIFSNGAE